MAEPMTQPETMTSGPSAPWADRIGALLGLAAVAWIAVSLAPIGMPAWPSATLGIFAIAFAWPAGRPLPRAAGAFLGFTGVVVGLAQIATIWGLAELLDR